MKILVDKMPVSVVCCPYSIHHETDQDGVQFQWFSCSKRKDKICQNVKKCEFFIDYETYQKEKDNPKSPEEFAERVWNNALKNNRYL